ncbi:MAG: hypothetical protein ACREBD_12665 [Blastocatellia bacterium]
MEHHLPTNDGAPSGQSFDWPPDYFASTEELIEAARDYFATDFPNPERSGCPASGALRSIVHSGQMPTAGLRAHLFGCSECFCEYREALLERRQLAVAPTTSRWRDSVAALLRWRAPLLAGAFVLLALGAGVFIWSSRKEPAPQISQSRPQPAPSEDIERRAPTGADVKSSEAQPTLTPAAPKTVGQRSKPADLLAINVDLNDYSSLERPRRRGVGSEEEKAIRLPRARVRLELKLPSGSDPGRYQVSIVDAYLRPVERKQAPSPDGNRLTVELDLRRLTQRSYYLRLTHGDGVPEFYRVSITTE